ncbi:MAG: hypothetical protein EP329_15260 [Deltaproteobacteria bacterium]|nr:MAG: hypothetical protein EP329_15260 [Deltaproteobacteria bacterium]
MTRFGVALVAFALVSPMALAAEPRKGPPKVIELETMVIEGKVAKPQVFYVLGRSRIQYNGIKLQRSFVDRIVESAKRNPF